MTSKLSISSALTYAVGRLATRGGATLLVGYAVYQLATQVVFQSLFAEAFGANLSSGQAARTFPLALDLPVAVSAVLTVVLVVGGTALAVVAMRAVYADIDAIPTADHTRRLVRTIIVAIVVSIIIMIATLVGSVFFLLPGLFLAVSLVFATVAVVIEDAGVIEAVQRSWTLASGHRLRLFVLGVLLAVVSGFVGAFITLLGVFAPVIGDLASGVMTGVSSLFGIAVLVGAYRQLAGASDGVNAPDSATP